MRDHKQTERLAAASGPRAFFAALIQQDTQPKRRAPPLRDRDGEPKQIDPEPGSGPGSDAASLTR